MGTVHCRPSSHTQLTHGVMVVEGLNPRIAFAIAAGAVGSSFQHGYNTGVLNAPQKIMTSWVKGKICANSTDGEVTVSLEQCDSEAELIWAWTVAIFCIGGMMGGSLVGFVSARLGRKGGLLLNNIVAVILFVVGFATGPGSIPWFFVTELFAQSGRPTATSIAVTVNWSANFLVGLGFEPIQMLMGAYVFILFMVIQFCFIIYVYFAVPETKNRTIDDITAQFRK